eukprot:TRINITY_DN11396_c3_g1_i1.p2 TRINITY_DN11396_c3_g1~~TRINITY_DN11396_c3_g1_i1.p2  ORF type:complete len:344 (+),score=140.93 TRINITY_DN11396_c3_g1_i1:74-1033(+)
MDSVACQALAGVGFLVALKAVTTAAVFFYSKFLRSGKNLKSLGAWAVVTGATDGIGKAFALELARKGLNVALLSRTQSKLEEVKKEVEAARAGTEVKIFSVDFSKFAGGDRADPAVAGVRDFIGGLEGGVAVLINNVGVSYEYPVVYHELDDKRAADLIELNINSTTWMTRLVLPGMVERKKGAIVSIASGAGMAPSPMLAGYSAAKQYVCMFTKSLAAEYAHIPGLSFQVQCPLFVTSKLSKIKRASITTPTPNGYAKVGVRAIGYEVECSPYWAHALQLGVLLSVPESLSNRVVLGMHKQINKAALRKKAREAAKQD